MSRSNSFLSPLAVAALLALLAACGPSAPATGFPLPAQAPAATLLPTVAAASLSPSPSVAPAHLLDEARQALAAYEPATDAQPLVGILLSSIGRWLDAGGDAAALAAILNGTPMQLAHGPVTVTRLDLTGGPGQSAQGPNGQARDLLVHIPVMDLPLLAFVHDGNPSVRFTGYTLPPDLESIRTDFPLEATEIDQPAGMLRFPMDAGGILYPGAGLAAYLNVHPELSGDLPSLGTGLAGAGFAVEGVAALPGGDLCLTLRLPDLPYAASETSSWQLAWDGSAWRVSQPASDEDWPTLGVFTSSLHGHAPEVLHHRYATNDRSVDEGTKQADPGEF